MAFRIIALVCLQFALFNAISANCINRFIPSCQQNLLPMPLQIPVTENILPNQMIIGPNYGQPIVEVPYGVETVVSNQMPATTIIQDSTVANNLANALQLLVVSNLLSNTLPLSSPEVIVPSASLGFGAPLDYGLMSPVSPIISPMSPVMSPINSCGFNNFNYVY